MHDSISLKENSSCCTSVVQHWPIDRTVSTDLGERNAWLRILFEYVVHVSTTIFVLNNNSDCVCSYQLEGQIEQKKRVVRTISVEFCSLSLEAKFVFHLLLSVYFLVFELINKFWSRSLHSIKWTCQRKVDTQMIDEENLLFRPR